ncbi:MAG TPA: HemK2/MTQ2 family protein methyltransferase [Nitrososphaera sp.]|nr:HemK2/MTQ2 family protein methyltransferase [Nitrososphaera sp.]
MYAPSDDTFLLADCIRQYSGRRALEIGVGSGLLLDILEKNFAYVAGSDIDLQALQHCKQQKISSARVLLVCCDAGSAFGIGKFDFIVSNPPYLPNDNDNNNILDPTVHGGPTGIEATVHFINSALPLLAGNGKLLIVISSFANSSALDKVVLENNMHKKVVKEKRLFYETLSIVELSL